MAEFALGLILALIIVFVIIRLVDNWVFMLTGYRNLKRRRKPHG